MKATYTPTSIDIPIGSRFSLNELNYVVLEKIGDGQLKIECESLGKSGNGYFGNVIPIEYIEGLETMQITELLIPGEDEEDTEDLRKRYFDSFNSKAYGGNIDDYLKKTNSIAGVGSTKVTPIWNGGGTVKLTILNSEYDKASSELIKSVQTIIDPQQDALGKGVAPIGHIVTVDTASEVKVNISTKLAFEDGHSFSNLKNAIKEKISEYLLEIRKQWATQTASVVRLAQLESRIMSVKGVLDISGTKINEKPENLILDKYEIPIMGALSND